MARQADGHMPTTAPKQTDDHTDDKKILDVEATLRTEAREIHAHKLEALRLDLQDMTGAGLYQSLNRLDSAALCLSGGGIRSAAFCLGVIQALASQPRSAPAGNDKPGLPCDQAQKCLLSKIHYLSTVSGGGYIGSWLSAWRARVSSWDVIWRELVSRPPGSGQEAPALGWLRSYSNYLTPKMGLTSADTWAAIALSVRNLMLNWIVIIPVFCTLILLLKLIAVLSDWATHIDDPVSLPVFTSDVPLLQTTFAISGVFCLILALSFIARNRPSQRTTAGPDQRRFLLRGLLPSFLAAALLAQFLASDYVGEALLRDGPGHVPEYPLWLMIAGGSVCGVFIYGVAWFAAWRAWNPKDLTFWSIAGAIYGSLLALGLYQFIQIPDEGIVTIKGGVLFSSVVLHLVFGWPWLIFSQLTADMIFAGLSDYQCGSDADREWLGRAAGWLVLVAIGWLILTFSVFFGSVLGPQIVTTETQASVRSWATTLAAVFGLITAILGMSSATPAQGPAKDRTASITNLALSIAAPLFVITLLIGLSFFLDLILLRTSLVPELFMWWSNELETADAERISDLLWLLNLPDSLLGPTRPEALAWLVIGLIVSAVIAAIASRCVNINRFSLHALYRNRLIRAFLGASRRHRKPDAFTGFDEQDNPRVHQLWSEPAPHDWRPFHIVNMALNIVSSTRLAWQERKAESFVVTPLHAGSGDLGFRPSAQYGGPQGITLGTAMAISGAAASPNLGYNSSPAITFLMTMFNLRLGWWLGNPGPKGARTFMHEGPRWAIKPLVDEALGLTTDGSAYVYLSDGGHFENLGLYEAVRRRCRFIVAVDAGCDPAFNFADLGNAMRKIQIDLGVNIRFVQLERLKKRLSDGSVLTDGDYCAIGLIDYISADGQPTKEQATTKDGFILYLKAGYHGTEGAAIRSYANAHPEFPHESTLDQWFSESQFESYRALGFEIADHVISRALGDQKPATTGDMDALFHRLWDRATKSPPAAAAG
jgi:hypothetical protein